jgi:hypothetical protein
VPETKLPYPRRQIRFLFIGWPRHGVCPAGSGRPGTALSLGIISGFDDAARRGNRIELAAMPAIGPARPRNIYEGSETHLDGGLRWRILPCDVMLSGETQRLSAVPGLPVEERRGSPTYPKPRSGRKKQQYTGTILSSPLLKRTAVSSCPPHLINVETEWFFRPPLGERTVL